MRKVKGLFKDLSIMQTIIGTITIIVALAVFVTVPAAYNIIRLTSDELVYEQAGEINKQIVYNYENYTSRVEGIANLLENKILGFDMARNRDGLEELFLTVEEMEGSVVALTVFDNNGQVVLSTRQVVADNTEIGVSQWYADAIFDDKIVHFTSPYEQTIYALPIGEVISASKTIRYTENGTTKPGVLLINMNFEGLQALSEFTNLGEKGHLLIMDADDAIVYSTNPEKYDENSQSYHLAKERIFGSLIGPIEGVKTVVNINTIPSTRWRIATFQDVNRVEEGMQSALVAAILLVAITLALTAFIAYFVARQITNPLTKLNRAINRLHDGNYDSKVTVEGQKELKRVILGFNEMIDRVRALMDEVVREQVGKRKTELRALQNQINPHFLYNTLDCIIWLAEEKRNEDLVETVGALSTYFRVSLSKGRQFIPVAEELRHIESYMLIQRMRYNDRFAYEVHCPEALTDIPMMKLILQPLVENAIYHGIDKDDPESKITIEVQERPEELVLSVTNSGYGITEERIHELHKVMEDGNKKGSIGMKNVHRRLKLFYGEQAHIAIESELDDHTTFSIILPKAQLEALNDQEGETL